MKTTLGEIMKYHPCGQEKGSNEGWDKLVSFLGTDDLSTEVTFRQILESNGTMDTVWALRTQPYRDYCMFLAEVAESVLHLYEKEYPKDDRPRKCINGIRRYHSGEISYKDLEKLKDDASDAWAASSAASDAASDAAWSDSWAAVSDAAWAASWAASSAVSSAKSSADAAVRAASCAASSAARAEKLEEIEKILLKYI